MLFLGWLGSRYNSLHSESLDLTVGSTYLAGMSVRVFAFRKRIENDIRTRSDNDLDTIHLR